jgi:ATP-dependent Lhr-like helicase
MVDKARAGRDALLIAPTGGGKTLAGFLPSLIQLAERPPANTPRGIHTLYISPLKALAVDVERNLMAPILEMGLNITAESRTGDTGLARRQRQRIKPPDILLTTPEQLTLFCAWEGARAYFADLACIIIDEIHDIHILVITGLGEDRHGGQNAMYPRCEHTLSNLMTPRF